MTKAEAIEGTLASFYTLKGYFVKVKQAYAIEKVVFSFVEKGTHGSGFNIYVSMDTFDNLCDDILSYTLLEKINNDNGEYPSAWKNITGDNGSKELSIGKGKMGIVIQGRDKKTKKNAFVPVQSYDDFRTMAKWYRRTSKKFYEDMTTLVLESDKYRPTEEKQQKAKELLQFETCGPASSIDMGYRIPVRVRGSQETTDTFLVIRRDDLPKIGNWQAFLYDLQQREIHFAANTEKLNGNNYLFLDQFTCS